MEKYRAFEGFDVSLQEMSEGERLRASRANQILTGMMLEMGMRVWTWHDFVAWKSYVDGKISDPELSELAREELSEFAGQSGKYLVIDEEHPKELNDPIKRARAKLANKIYRKVCEEAGLELCFFTNFRAWSDYVRGALGESEFYERAKEEMARMIGESVTKQEERSVH